ncbi:MBG domain-containing protein [Oleiharenicola lentus]|uniref:MBG domain-containing protein n=1 Tax=Oleiharenicola lentus TaxID=2508720 RepID=UPI003F678028
MISFGRYLFAAASCFAALSLARGAVVQSDLVALTRTGSILVGISTAGEVKRSTNGGSSFSTVRNASSSALRNLESFSNTVVAIGDAGFIARSGDSGQSWSDLSVSAAPAFVGELRDVASKDGSFWVTVGKANGNLVTLWSDNGGATWNYGSVPGLSGTLHAVAYDTGTTRWTAVGSDGFFDARILNSTDGKTWSAVSVVGAAPLNDVSSNGAGRLLAVGDAGTLLVSVDGGQTFNADVNSGLVSENLNAVVSTSTGWAVGGDDLVQLNYPTAGSATVTQSPVPGGGAITTLAVDSGGEVLVVGEDFSGYQTITFSGPANQAFSSTPITLSATASSGLSVAFSVVSGPATVSGNQLSLTGAGTVTVRAEQSGNATYNPAPPVERSFVVSAPAATVSLGNLSATYDGTAKSVTATTMPTGLTVSITYAGSTTAPTNAGSYAVVATIIDPNYSGSASDTLVIAKASQTITFAPLADRPYSTTPITLTATASSELAVTFSATGSATVSGNELTLTGSGAVSVTATQAGNTNYASVSLTRSFVVSGGFESWRATNFTSSELADANVSGPNAVYGQDGLSNLLKYALGFSARTNVAEDLPEVSTTSSDWVYLYTRPTAITDVTYEVEVSTSLTSWSAVGVTHEIVSSSGGIDTWRARYPLSSATNAFFRLKISH